MVGLLLRNDRGGMLISDETPAFLQVFPQVVSENHSGSAASANFVGVGRGLNGVTLPAPWAGGGVASSLTIRLPSDVTPLVAVAYNVLFRHNGVYSFSFSYNAVQHTRGSVSGVGSVVRGIFVESIVRRPELDSGGLFTFTVNIFSSVGGVWANELRFYSPYSDSFYDSTQENGLTVRKADGTRIFSTAVTSPYTSAVTAKLKSYGTAQIGSPLLDTSFANARINTANTGMTVDPRGYYLISSGGYGSMVSDSLAMWHGWQDGWNGWSETSYGAAGSFYRVGFCVINNYIHSVPVPVNLEFIPSRDRSDSGLNFAGLAAVAVAAYTGGTSLAFAVGGVALATGNLLTSSNSFKVDAPNTTYDGHINSVIEIK